MVDQAVLDKLEAGFSKVAGSDSKSLLKKYLSKEVFDQLKTKKTSFGSTLLDVIQSGVENLDSGVGIYAPDADSYTVFADLFDPIIEDYHGGFKKTDKHPPKDFGDVDSLGNLDPAVSIEDCSLDAMKRTVFIITYRIKIDIANIFVNLFLFGNNYKTIIIINSYSFSSNYDVKKGTGFIFKFILPKSYNYYYIEIRRMIPRKLLR